MQDERVRLFVALELPAPVRDALTSWCERAVARSRGLRVVAADSLHVTMCFLGWRASGEVDAIGAACGVLAGVGALHLSLADSRWLPPRRPRVLAVELDDAGEALTRAQATLSQVLGEGGWYEPEHRRYLPHVTVARVPRRGRAPAGELPPLSRLEFDATRVTLFRSRLLRAGARYEPLTTIELGR